MGEFGITQERLADELGVTQAAVSRYIQGRIPRADTLVALAGYFPEVETKDLLYKDLSTARLGKGEIGAIEAIEQKLRGSQEIARLIERLAAIPEPYRSRFLNMLNPMLDGLVSSELKNIEKAKRPLKGR